MFSIACKINLGLFKNNGNPGGRGGDSFGFGNPGGRGGQLIQEIRVGGGVKEPCHLSGGGGGGVGIFSGIFGFHVTS